MKNEHQLDTPSPLQGETALETALRLAKHATNGWACYAKRKVEHDEIARLHREIDAAYALGARGVSAPERGTREWKIDDYGGDEPWHTQCGNAYIFLDGGPLENGATFCCYCGKPLIEQRTSESPAHASEGGE